MDLEQGDREAVKRLLPHLVSKVTLDFTKRKATSKFWRIELLEGAEKSTDATGTTWHMSPEAAKRLNDRVTALESEMGDSIRVYLKYDPRNVLEAVGKF